MHSHLQLHLLESFDTIGTEFEINEISIVVRKNPLLNYSDFISYNPDEFTFEISDDSRRAIENLQHSVNGLAFAILADKELIYTGYFWPGYSSRSCNWLVTDPMTLKLSNKMEVKLGYPGQIDGVLIPDRRNDIRILNIFRRDNMLIE